MHFFLSLFISIYTLNISYSYQGQHYNSRGELSFKIWMYEQKFSMKVGWLVWVQRGFGSELGKMEVVAARIWGGLYRYEIRIASNFWLGWAGPLWAIINLILSIWTKNKNMIMLFWFSSSKLDNTWILDSEYEIISHIRVIRVVGFFVMVLTQLVSPQLEFPVRRKDKNDRQRSAVSKQICLLNLQFYGASYVRNLEYPSTWKL